MNEFNQTYQRLEQAAQGLGQGVEAQIDRIPAYSISQEKRTLVNGIMSQVKRPLTYIYATGTLKAALGNITLGSLGEIQSISIADGGAGYAPGATYAICIRGGSTATTTPQIATLTAKADGDGRISSFEVVDGGKDYTVAGDTGYPAMTAEIDESPMLGQFVVSRFNSSAQTGIVGTGTAQEPQIPSGVGAITSMKATGGLSGNREGVWFVQHGNGHTMTVLAADGNASLGKLETVKFQVYVNADGLVTKTNLIEFGEGFAVGDVIKVQQSQLGAVADDVTSNELTITIENVTSSDQLKYDFGTAIWRSETFETGTDVVVEYTIDTTIDTNTSNGFLRTLAEDLCLHPYANYYSSAWSTQAQRTATLTFSGLSELVTSTTDPVNQANGDGLLATLTDPETGDVLSAAEGFQISDIGKRIIEPFGNGTVVITGIGTGAAPDNKTAGTAICSMATLSGANIRSSEDVNEWSNNNIFTYLGKRWRLAIQRKPFANSYDSGSATTGANFPGMVQHEGGFESQPYNLIYPRLDAYQDSGVYIRTNGQQNHREVMTAIRRIGDLFVVESEKSTDTLSSKADINAATKSIPSTVNLTQPVRDRRKPQKWRMRFYYDSRDEYLYVNIATPLQILDNGNLASGQGRDGIKGAVFRQPGELSEIYYNFSNDKNKAKSGFFRRQGKTDSGIDSSYPMAYRLSCTDHGTGFFLFDQASVDQDDDYAWFVVQRHVNNVSGKIESEDGKSPVHCLYSPSKRPEEQSDYNMGFYASVSSSVDPATGITTVSSKSLGELEIYDINGRKLKAGIPLQASIVTKGGRVASRTIAYGGGLNYAQTPVGGIPLTDNGALGTDVTAGYTSTNDIFQFPALDGVTSTIKNYESAEQSNLDGTVIQQLGVAPNTVDIDGFSLAYPQTVSDSTFVPVGDYFTALNATDRFTAADDTGVAGIFTTAYGLALSTPKTHVGLKNYASARNQMQGPTRLGLKLSRVRHRSAGGVDTVLDPQKDFKIVSRQEVAARTDADGQPRELPVSSAVALFTPTSTAAQALVKNRRVKVIFYDTIQWKMDSGNTVYASSLFDPLTFGALPNKNAATIKYKFENTARLTTQLGAAPNTYGTTMWTPEESEIVPISGFGLSAGSTQGYILDVAMNYIDPAGTQPSSGAFSTKPGANNLSGVQVDMKVGDVVTVKGEFTATTGGSADGSGAKITNVVDTFPEGDLFIYEYAWEGSGENNEYTNYYGRSGIGSNPLFEVNRLKIFVDGQEADAAILGQNYNITNDGDILFGDTTSSLEYFGSEKPIFAYNMQNDTFKFAQGLEDGVVVKLSYENYSDTEEKDTGKSSYLIKLPEDRDIPNIWHDIHKVAKGIYRFVVRESDVFKPWDFHVSAVIPQVDSPACINPVEQLSITQDKTVIFNFPTPLASQRFIYSDAEADIICIAGADSSTQGGIIKTASTKFDLDAMQNSGYKNNADDGNYPAVLDSTDAATIQATTQYGLDADGVVSDANVSTSTNDDKLNFRREYTWHNPFQGPLVTATGARTGATASPQVTAFDTPSNSTHRTYLGMMSTKPYGNGMRLFIICRGGPIRPEYTDYTPRDQVDANNNTFT